MIRWLINVEDAEGRSYTRTALYPKKYDAEKVAKYVGVEAFAGDEFDLCSEGPFEIYVSRVIESGKVGIQDIGKITAWRVDVIDPNLPDEKLHQLENMKTEEFDPDWD